MTTEVESLLPVQWCQVCPLNYTLYGSILSLTFPLITSLSCEGLGECGIPRKVCESDILIRLPHADCILHTLRKSGCQMEKSVLSLWK